MLPKRLVRAFEDTQACSLVTTGKLSRESLDEFVECLNAAIPARSNSGAFSVYRFNRLKYTAGKQRFLNDIKDFKPYEAMILWADYKDILAHFGLQGKVFLGWDKKNSRYRAFSFASEKRKDMEEPTAEPVQQSSPEKPCSAAELEFDKEVNATTRMFDDDVVKRVGDISAAVKKGEDEMDRLYQHMQARIAATHGKA